MNALIDVDQLRTFIAIVETGSFTKAADVVHKTQSAVSMQMKRLEERLDRAIFARDGRASKLTEDGERLLDYARRIIKLNVEALAAFNDAQLTGGADVTIDADNANKVTTEVTGGAAGAKVAITPVAAVSDCGQRRGWPGGTRSVRPPLAVETLNFKQHDDSARH